jgi:hypothetical protein
MRKTSLRIEIRMGEFNLIEDNNSHHQSQPVKYIARDERGLVMASKTYNNATPWNSIDFIDYLMQQVGMPIRVIRADMSLVFQRKFEEHLMKLGIQFERTNPSQPFYM